MWKLDEAKDKVVTSSKTSHRIWLQSEMFPHRDTKRNNQPLWVLRPAQLYGLRGSLFLLMSWVCAEQYHEIERFILALQRLWDSPTVQILNEPPPAPHFLSWPENSISALEITFSLYQFGLWRQNSPFFYYWIKNKDHRFHSLKQTPGRIRLGNTQHFIPCVLFPLYKMSQK